jgi:hypothetical protein
MNGTVAWLIKTWNWEWLLDLVQERCLFRLCTMWLKFEPTFWSDMLPPFQGNETPESFQLVMRICLTMDGEESLLHLHPTVEFIHYSGVDSQSLVVPPCTAIHSLLLSYCWGWGWIMTDDQSSSVSWGQAPILGTWPDFIAVGHLQSSCCGVPSLMRGWVCNLLVQFICTLRFKACGTCYLNLLYCLVWDFPNPEGQVSCTYIPHEQGGPVIPPGTGFPFLSPLNDLQGYGGSVLAPPSTWEWKRLIIDNLLTYLPAFLPTYLPTYLPTHLLTEVQGDCTEITYFNSSSYCCLYVTVSNS